MKSHLLLSLLSILGLQAFCLSAAETGSPIRPLAQDHIVVATSDRPIRNPLWSPAIIALPDGRLVASYMYAELKTGLADSKPTYQQFLTSDDHGLTWQKRGTSSGKQGRFFLANGIIYYIATGSRLPIQKSTDNGTTWGPISYLTNDGRSWNQTAANTWTANGRIYLVMETIKKAIDAWNVTERVIVPMSAPLDADLTQSSNWTFADNININDNSPSKNDNLKAFGDVLPGTRENDPAIDYFGIPFYPQDYPKRSYITRSPKTRSFSPIGYVESNIVQVLDPNHYWFDPTGHTFHILSRFQSGITNYGALTKVTEDPETKALTTSLQTVPSGKKLLILPLPGGQMRFHISYDPQTKLYWLLSTQTTDSMVKADKLPPERFDLAFNERQRMVLHFSKNLVDWCFAGLVATETAHNGSRHYACMDIDGDDLVILSRSGDSQAASAHNGNIITFHRVQNFRNLVY